MEYLFASAAGNSKTFNIGDLSSWNTSKVTNMHDVFSRTATKASNVNVGNLGTWDTSNVIYMEGMFETANLNSWELIDLSRWNVCNVCNISR